MGKDHEFLEAARNGNISYIEKVLNQKAKRAGPLASLRRGTGVNVQDNGGYSALHHACINGHADIVKLLLAHEASTNLPDLRGSSPLHLASWAGEEEIVKMLLTHPYRPANPNLPTIEKETPLHCAAQHGHIEVLSILLAYEADPNMRNARGETPLDLACQYGRLQAVQMLIRAHPELIATYTKQATENSVNNRSSRHSSPLPHSGSISTPSPSSPSILSSPATPTRCVFPHTCLHLASRNGHKQVVEVLLGAGVNVNLLTPSGSALHEAALCGKESVVRTLLKAGIDLNATDAEDRTVLDILKEFPPHVTKHIIDVINNFPNQMDTDEGEEVIFRHQQPGQQRNHNSGGHYQKQQHNNHYHFNSNNHLLNHSLSMQQSSYNKQRFSSGATFNGGGKSLDSGLQLDENSPSTGTANRYYQDNLNSPVRSQSNTSQNDMGVSPSSSMSSFEPASVSPRSRCSTGGVSSFIGNTPTLSSFGPGGPPKKPPRRNLSVSPTNSGQPFSYTSPNHQQQNNFGRRHTRSPSNDSPYSHQSQGSVGGISFDESQLTERQRGNRLFASARESTRTSGNVSLSSSTDMLEKRHHSEDVENLVPNSNQEITNSMKRPKPAPRNLNNSNADTTTTTTTNDNATLKSYNPNRKLKRNRNSYSVTLGDKEDKGDENRPQIPQSPTNYKQPPTPDHPPPSSSQAEKMIHERIRPLSQEYKRRSALLQLQKQQQLLVDIGTSPLRQINNNNQSNNNNNTHLTSHYDYAYIQASPTKLATNNVNSNIYSTIGAGGIRGSLGSLSSSVSLSDHSGSTENVEEFIGDQPFAGLLKGSAVNSTSKPKLEPAYATVNKAAKIYPPQVQLPPPRPQQQLPPQAQVPVYATIHKKRGITTTAQAQEQLNNQKPRPPIPAKPVVPERRLFKAQTPKLPTTASQQYEAVNTTTIDLNHEQEQQDHEMKNDSDDLYEDIPEPKTIVENNVGKHVSEVRQESQEKPASDILSHQSSVNSSSNEEQSQQTSSQPTNESSNEDSSIANTSTTSHESSILSPFNAEEARKKISEILESFGSSILNSDISPTNDLDFDDMDIPTERQELMSRLRKASLGHLEKKLFEHGYDNYKFMNGVFESGDIDVININQQDGAKLLRFINTLPKAEFLPQITLKNQQENKSQTELKGVSSLQQWLNSIQLPQYTESFNKHLYNTLDSVCGVWDVELQTVLEINKLGHRRRILQSIAFIKNLREPKSAKTPLAENNETNKISSNSTHKDGPPRQSVTGYRKNRPAPQPPTQKATQQTPTTQTSLDIRGPSELLLDLPDNSSTKWRHTTNELLNNQIKYEVYYLGSTVVKELRGTESTRKSIQKLKQDQQYTSATNMLMSSQSETNAARNQSFNKQKRILVSLAISHRGVEFIDVNSKNTICEHEIQNINCACQDAEDLSHFAYITKENDVHYCHVFHVESTDLASDIILTLGQAFEVAYQLALRDGITATPLATLNHSILQGLEYTNQPNSSLNNKTQEA